MGKTPHPTPHTPHPAPTKNFFSSPYLKSELLSTPLRASCFNGMRFLPRKIASLTFPTPASVLVPKTHTFPGNTTRRSSVIASGIVVRICLSEHRFLRIVYRFGIHPIAKSEGLLARELC
ncbi:MAG: hypothetical protein GPI90_20195 [Microcystis aeruginosa K13-05]|nr:hypothetical protein [Microcystis aeruginosa K13-10]NCR86812.1 hypothetical protein [Microcystis aeruginosa K13-05]